MDKKKSALRSSPPAISWAPWKVGGCGRPVLPGRRERSDLYTGPWNTSTLNPILVIGNRYDPRTAFANSLLASRPLGNAVLLTLNGFGHTSDADPSACIDEAVTNYLITLATPQDMTVCQPDRAPFDPDFGQSPIWEEQPFE
jgi:hypothetical protein